MGVCWASLGWLQLGAHCPPPVTCLRDTGFCHVDASGGRELHTFRVVKLNKKIRFGVFALVMTAGSAAAAINGLHGSSV